MLTIVLICTAIAVLIGLGLLIPKILTWRRIVPPNEVHVVRQGNNTFVYGATGSGQNSGNIYYEWPKWMPILGVQKTVLPLSIFDIKLDDYECYDKGRVSFLTDIQAFFRISDYRIAAAHIKSDADLRKQLIGVIQGAARNLFSEHPIETILGEYSSYGNTFTDRVKRSIKDWGISMTKNIELMDIKDAKNSCVIKEIRERKKSQINMESRKMIAENNKKAREAEIEASQAVEMREKRKEETVGTQAAKVEATIGIHKQRANQMIQDATKKTKAKEVEVFEVETLGRTKVEGQQTVIVSEAKLEATKKESEGVVIAGKAKADAEKELQMASVAAQTALAKEIGNNPAYQDYLVQKRKIEASENVGVEQAKNLSGADIRVVAGAGDMSTGVGKAAGVISGAGGLGMSAMLTGLSASPEGKALLDSVNSFLGKRGEGINNIVEQLNSSEEGRELLTKVLEFLGKNKNDAPKA